jgi:GNAT superfamily N-acetyltransferase
MPLLVQQNPAELKLRPMTLADIPLGMRLKQLANWNQLPADWDFLIRAGAGGNFVASYQGKEAGTVTTLSYQNRFSWIGMVLVDPQFRGLGIGTALLHQAIDQAAAKGAVRLDATPQGQKLYDTLGFKTERELVRLQRPPLVPTPSPGQEVKWLSNDLLPRLAGLDRTAFGADRMAVLRYLQSNAPEYAFYVEQDQEITGYCLGRGGSAFSQIGPIVAHRPEDARDLLLAALSASPDRAFVVDAPAEKTGWLEELKTLGFAGQRPFIRMYRGELRHPGEPGLPYAIAGPELG